MCPIIHFVALAFADQAFQQGLLAQGLSPFHLHKFKNPEGRITIDFSFGDHMLDVPIFRTHERRLEEIRVHPFKAPGAKSIGRESRRLGERSGLPHPFRPYCLRREASTELTGELVARCLFGRSLTSRRRPWSK